MHDSESIPVDPVLLDEPVSSEEPAFHKIIRQHFHRDETVVFLLRYSRMGGARYYYIANSLYDFEKVGDHVYPNTSITAFFESDFASKNTITEQTASQMINTYGLNEANCEGISLVNCDKPGFDQNDDFVCYFDDPQEVFDWCNKYMGDTFMAGELDFTQNNNPNVITVYVPDNDGKVRPGAY